MDSDRDRTLYPNAGDPKDAPDGVSRRRFLLGSAGAGAIATAGCTGSPDDSTSTTTKTDEPTHPATVFVFNTGEASVSLIDVERDERIETRSIGLTSSFPSNQYSPELTDSLDDALWVNAGRGVRALSVRSLSTRSSFDTGSGANWLERTPDGSQLVVSAREPTHAQFRLDADPGSDTFGKVTGEIDRSSEGGTGDREGPGPCDVTIHPGGEYAYVPDIFGDSLTVLSVEPFEIETQVSVPPIGDGPSRPWMGTVAPDGNTLLVEHDEGDHGTESVWDVSDPANPAELARLSAEDGLGRRPLTSEIGPDSETGYVFTPGSNDVTVIDLADRSVSGGIDLGGAAFTGTWDPSHEKLYVPVQTNDDVAVVDHASGGISTRIPVGSEPYGATAAGVRPPDDPTADLSAAFSRLAALGGETETSYCIGKCACGHRL